MSVELLRKLLSVLVILSLAVPSLGMRPCCCNRTANVAKSSVPGDASALAPCCAKRLAAAQAARDAAPALKAKCCCGDLRWSQAVAKTLPTRVDESRFVASFAIQAPANVIAAAAVSPADGEEIDDRTVIPSSHRRIALCRWQI